MNLKHTFLGEWNVKCRPVGFLVVESQYPVPDARRTAWNEFVAGVPIITKILTLRDANHRARK